MIFLAIIEKVWNEKLLKLGFLILEHVIPFDRQHSVFSSGVSSETPAKLGIQLTGGPNVTRNGEPGIFVENVNWGSVAEGKLFPGDKIIAVVRNSFQSA